jgi:hypothetical protein
MISLSKNSFQLYSSLSMYVLLFNKSIYVLLYTILSFYVNHLLQFSCSLFIRITNLGKCTYLVSMNHQVRRICMRRKVNYYNMSPWVKQFKVIAGQFIVPITIFQTIRTLIFPTPVDLVLLSLLILLGVALHMEWI